MTNPLYEHLAPGPQRDEAEVEARMATARETIARLERERDEVHQLLAQCVKYAREDRMTTPGSTRLARVLARAEQVLRRDCELSGNPGEFAALAERIAFADGKHPRDLPDMSREISAERAGSRLESARAELEAFPAWDNVFECEVAEASVEAALGNAARLADELLDVATVAMRWRRAVMERGKD